MSYRCNCCDKQVPAKQTQKKRVTAIRPRTYRAGVTGWEIVKEEKLCKKCDDALNEEEKECSPTSTT